MSSEYIFYQIIDKKTNKVVDEKSMPLRGREWFPVLLVRQMYELHYLPIIRYTDGTNEAEFKRLNEAATHQVHAHLTTTPLTGFCIPDSPTFTFHLHEMRS